LVRLYLDSPHHLSKHLNKRSAFLFRQGQKQHFRPFFCPLLARFIPQFLGPTDPQNQNPAELCVNDNGWCSGTQDFLLPFTQKYGQRKTFAPVQKELSARILLHPF
jgi:hypothetical protein